MFCSEVIEFEGEDIGRVGSFEYLGARIEANGETTPEIRRRLVIATAKLNKMADIWIGHERQNPQRHHISDRNIWM